MSPFTMGEIESVRVARKRKWSMASICRLLPNHTRDEVVEAIDACHRHPANHDAQRHVNQVLAYQDAGIPLINGRPAHEVWAQRPAAMFDR
jgi:hypothetical protein